MRKLVRDRIPDRMDANHEAVPRGFYTTDIEYHRALLEKQVEEAQEALAAFNEHPTLKSNALLIEEQADLDEVREAIYGAMGISPSDVEEAKLRKRAKNGAFARRLWCEF